uniref:Uncharacterized protein n=1 Tax=Ceratitis capitata TaxID=7213 RepID=W8B7K4_CERCA
MSASCVSGVCCGLRFCEISRAEYMRNVDKRSHDINYTYLHMFLCTYIYMFVVHNKTVRWHPSFGISVVKMLCFLIVVVVVSTQVPLLDLMQNTCVFVCVGIGVFGVVDDIVDWLLPAYQVPGAGATFKEVAELI